MGVCKSARVLVSPKYAEDRYSTSGGRSAPRGFADLQCLHRAPGGRMLGFGINAGVRDWGAASLAPCQLKGNAVVQWGFWEVNRIWSLCFSPLLCYLLSLKFVACFYREGFCHVIFHHVGFRDCVPAIVQDQSIFIFGASSTLVFEDTLQNKSGNLS